MNTKTVKLGDTIPSFMIDRATFSNGTKSRAIIISPDHVFAKTVAFAEKVKRYVEVTQEDAVNFKLNAFNLYYTLIARLNTGMDGQIASDGFKLEYLQMSEKMYKEIVSRIKEVPSYTHIAITKGPLQKNAQGKDVSETSIEASGIDISNEVKEAITKVQSMRSNPAMIESIWAGIDANLALSVQEYIEKLKELGVEARAEGIATAPAIEASPVQEPKAIEGAPVSQPVQPEPTVVDTVAEDVSENPDDLPF